MRRARLSLAALAVCLSLTGCVGAAIHAGKAVVDQGMIAREEDAAQAGDPVAEYRMGEAYCCSAVGYLDPVKDNRKATFWLCRAARRGYGPAELRIARIASGDLTNGLGIRERLVGSVAGHEANPAVALMWARLAAASPDAKAAADGKELVSKLEKGMNDDDRKRADILVQNRQAAPCEWNELFPPHP